MKRHFMRYYKIALLVAAAAAQVQCSDDNNNDEPLPQQPRPEWTVADEQHAVTAAPQWSAPAPAYGEAPQWVAALAGNDAAPQWQAPDHSLYPSSMTAVIKLPMLLEAFAGDGDEMAAFIGDDCRGVAQKVTAGDRTLYFIQIKAASEETGSVQLRYYCSALTRIFTATAVPFVINDVYGTADEPAIPDFAQSGRYPVTATAYLRLDGEALPFTPSADDEIAAFAGDECRSVLHWADADAATYCLTLMANDASERLSLRYYSALTGATYTADATVLVTGDPIGSADAPMLLTLTPQGSMTAYFTLDSALLPYAAADSDMLAAFAGDACVGVAEVVDAAAPVYKIVVFGTIAEGAPIDLRYYSSRCQFIFDVPQCLTFASSAVAGSPQQPATLPIGHQSHHPLRMEAYATLPDDLAPYASADDMLGAFVGDDCRGLATVAQDSRGAVTFHIVIYGSITNDESITFRYYSASRKTLYVSTSAIPFAAGTRLGSADAHHVIDFKSE